jgi:hypothetical protein
MTGALQPMGSLAASPTFGSSGCITLVYTNSATRYNSNYTSRVCGLKLLMLSMSQTAQ